MQRREKKRDDRDYDTTQLRESGHGKTLGRDYSAHFFRWSFARRFITTKHNVLEIGCGEDKPLSKILTGGASARVKNYVGVDMNKLKESAAKKLNFIGEFNFVTQHKKLKPHIPDGEDGFDVIVHYEVIEHMKVEHGRKMLRNCFDLLKPGGVMLMSTPCYDGVRHAANHIHEYTVPELMKATNQAGFEVTERYGTFMDIKHAKKGEGLEPDMQKAVKMMWGELANYYDNDALSCFFAPLFPDLARNNLWVCKKPEDGKKYKPPKKTAAQLKAEKECPF